MSGTETTPSWEVVREKKIDLAFRVGGSGGSGFSRFQSYQGEQRNVPLTSSENTSIFIIYF